MHLVVDLVPKEVQTRSTAMLIDKDEIFSFGGTDG